MDVPARIRGILIDDVLVEVAPGQMQPQDNLREGYGMDSLGFIELRVQCEEVFGITITDEDFAPENVETLGDVTALVERLLHQQEQTLRPA